LAAALAVLTAVSAAEGTRAEEPVNLLRNGSFEGGLLYWHNIDARHHRLVAEGGKVGRFALRCEGGMAMSAPFVAERGKPYTVSFWAKAERPGEVHVQMPPSAREEGQRSGRLWTREATQVAKVGAEWQRVSFTWRADVPQSGFWPLPHYMVQIGGTVPLLVDGVTVVAGDKGTAEYVPRRAVEIVAECPDLPGYAGGKANLFDRGATVRMTAHASNPGGAERAVTLRWQLFDYEGARPVAEPVDRKVTIPAGGTVSETVPLKLAHVGCVIARLSVLDGDKAVDSSDFPLTSLPYPKAATKPDWRERFGGSFAGGKGCVEKFQRLGFGWIRWRPHMNGEDHLPEAPKPGAEWKWRWFDAELDEQESHGCSTHCVLYPPPKWIMEAGHPLPKDMRWPADDPRWDDLSVETVWDKFVKGAVAHYKGRSLIYEIENEPEFDGWDHKGPGRPDGLFPAYAKFTIRTARLIKQVDPKAKVMVDNVYGIPSSVNAAFLRAGGAKFIDVFSWHDYHAGWLTDATGMRRMRQNLDEAGGKHVEIWFNEGWAFTNTAVDEPPACTGLTSAQGTNAVAACVAELSANGQDKTILFHTAYEQHGMSFWDYSGPGTMLWDWYNYPLPLVAMWNVMAHHIGVSESVGWVRPVGCNFAVFRDLRNGRGVMVAYADREAPSDVTVTLPDFGAAVTAEDIMGNAAPAGKTITLSRTGRVVYLYTDAKTPAETLLEKMRPLDRKNAGFVTASAGGPQVWSLPPSWEGTKKGESDGSVAAADGKPVWKLEQLWPADWKKRGNWRPMTWTGTDWNVKEGGFGGQPGARLDGRVLQFGTRAPHGQPMELRTAGVTFVAPKAGAYVLSGGVECRLWDGKQKTFVRVLHRSAAGVREIKSLAVAHGGKDTLDGIRAELAEGDELTVFPQIEGAYAGGNCNLRDLRIALDDGKGGAGTGAAGAAAGAVQYRLPAAREGARKGSADGNPVSAGGKPVWRIDQVWPSDKIIMAENYRPMIWGGTEWTVADHGAGGQPAVRIADGGFNAAVRGPWGGEPNTGQRIAGVVFIAPSSGVFKVKGVAKSRPWTGEAKSLELAILKKDTQRAAEVKRLDLPRGGDDVPFELTVELTAGHELVFLPLVPHHHNASNVSVRDLVIEAEPAK
jgi:hypothetical protein